MCSLVGSCLCVCHSWMGETVRQGCYPSGASKSLAVNRCAAPHVIQCSLCHVQPASHTEQQAKVAVGVKDAASDRPPIGAASPQKKQRTPTKLVHLWASSAQSQFTSLQVSVKVLLCDDTLSWRSTQQPVSPCCRGNYGADHAWCQPVQARPPRIADMFAKALPADPAALLQRAVAAQQEPAAGAAAEPALRTPHLSGKFGAMGMASPPAAAAGRDPAGQQHRAAPSGARKQLFVAEPPAGERNEAVAHQGCSSSSHSFQGGSKASAADAARAPPGKLPAALDGSSSAEVSWPDASICVSSRRTTDCNPSSTAASRQQLEQQRKPGRKTARSRVPEQRAAGHEVLQLAVAREPTAQGLCVAAAAIGPSRQVVSGGSTPINLITPDRQPETIDLTSTDS
jgi:hypothetical protein